MSVLSELGMDLYDRRARLRPALLLILPAALTIIALADNPLGGWPMWLAVLLQAGGGFVLAQFVGDIGRKREKALFDAWGGRPTENLLSHEHAGNKVVLKARHKKFGKLIAGVKAPTEEAEAKDPAAANQVYAAVADRLRAHVRGKPEGEAAHRENIHYGFRRNSWGLKMGRHRCERRRIGHTWFGDLREDSYARAGSSNPPDCVGDNRAALLVVVLGRDEIVGQAGGKSLCGTTARSPRPAIACFLAINPSARSGLAYYGFQVHRQRRAPHGDV